MGRDHDEPGSERGAGKLVDTRGRYLHVIRTTPEVAADVESEDEAASSEHDSDPSPVSSSFEATSGANGRDAVWIMGQIVMHSAMAWVAACTERNGYDVEVAQVGAGVFDAGVHLVGGGTQMLRVATRLESGPRLALAIEPIHP